jgi:hypothetical protein
MILIMSDISPLQIATDTHSYIGSDVASLCSDATSPQICERMDLIDLDEVIIDAEVLEPSVPLIHLLSARPLLKYPPSFGVTLVVWTRSS